MPFKPKFAPLPKGVDDELSPSLLGQAEQEDLIQQSNNAYRFNQDLISLEKLLAYIKSSESSDAFIRDELDPKWKEIRNKVQLARENPETARPDLATAQRLLANIEDTVEAVRSGQYQVFTRAIMPTKNKWFPDRTESIIKDPNRFIKPEEIYQKIQDMQQQPEAGHGVIAQIAPYNSYWGFFKLSRDEISDMAYDEAHDKIDEVFNDKLERHMNDISFDISEQVEARLEDEVNDYVYEKYQDYLFENDLDENNLTSEKISEIKMDIEYNYRESYEYTERVDELEKELKEEYEEEFRRENYDDILQELIEEETDRISESSEYEAQEFMISINFPQEAWDDDEFTAFVRNMGINRHQISRESEVPPMAFALIVPKTPYGYAVSYNKKLAWIISQIQSDFCSKVKHVFDTLKSSIPQKTKSGLTEIRGLKESLKRYFGIHKYIYFSNISNTWYYTGINSNEYFYLSPIYQGMYNVHLNEGVSDENLMNMKQVSREDLTSGKYNDLESTMKLTTLPKNGFIIGNQSIEKICDAIMQSLSIDGKINFNHLDINSIAILPKSDEILNSILNEIKSIYDNYQTNITNIKEYKFAGIIDPIQFINKYSHFINNWAQIAITKVISLARKYGIEYVIMNSSESIQKQTEDGIPSMTADFIYDETPKQLGFESDTLFDREMWVRAAERMDARGRHVLADKLIFRFISSLRQ